MEQGTFEYHETLRLFVLVAATVGAILPSIYSLSHGIYEVFPFFYLLPIILVIYFYPRYGVLYSLCMGLIFIGLVYYYSSPNAERLAVATVWFAIFIVIGVVASSYANRLKNEAMKIQKMFENSQDGLFCFDRKTRKLVEINTTCTRMLNYRREDLIGRDISVIWPSGSELPAFLTDTEESSTAGRLEVSLVARDKTPCRCLLQVILTSQNLVLCSAFDIKKQRIADEEIHRTLEDLERQVRERTAHLERINEEIREKIQKRWQPETTPPMKNSNDESIQRGQD
ncbi:MAG: PAS fold protein [Methanoregula sp. PtaU1.Bin051]|nr:MAG: PAS fold protein [Methanoregula sp. PtaU1.Bin051]